MKFHMTTDYRGGPGAGQCVCLYFLSESPNKPSNLLIVFY